ncbi:MAG: [FeFe] hydrogenase H-cluster radical SAM maturase HydE [Lachnospiraceae bacterium]|nr:[FeFe] hydrogenase H-cluster radical SAM maturase HydE [Lachnospiraceae bacterium]
MTDRNYIELTDKLAAGDELSDEELGALIECEDREAGAYLTQKAIAVREKYYGKKVFIRGLIEFSSYCRNNCFYCGIRRDNKKAERYRLSKEQILSCCETGYRLGFRTFVLQSGEDPYFADEILCGIVRGIRMRFEDCAITLSVGERDRGSYEKLFAAGADRYLLRHETADEVHYGMLHPEEMLLSRRLQCLRDLRDIGYQVGCGMMVGSPYQKTEHLIKDLKLIREFRPEMVGIGPFLPHQDTEFADQKAGSPLLTLRLLSIIRLMHPTVLLPATTALGTADPRGREKGLLAGANVVMPNLSPVDVRGKYTLYDNKICTGEEAAECIRCLSLRVSKTGYEIVTERGDPVTFGSPETP